MPRGRQRRVRSPGRNRKLAVFGAWRYGLGSFLFHIQPRKTAWGFRLLLQKLVRRARRTGRTIRLVLDRGNPHHAKAIQHDLENVKTQVTVFWLPTYSPELNLIEILWRHLKRSRLANVLFRSGRQFQAHVEQLLRHFATQPDLALRIVTPQGRAANRRNLLRAT
jgi:putative transposase